MEYKHSNYYCLDEDEVNIKNTNKTNTSFPECDVIIGYSENGYVPAVFLVLSVIGLILNLYLIIDYFRKKSQNSSRKQSSMKKLFNVLPVLDCITCLYWILSSSFFWRAEVIKQHENICFSLSLLFSLRSKYPYNFIYICFYFRIYFHKFYFNSF